VHILTATGSAWFASGNNGHLDQRGSLPFLVFLLTVRAHRPEAGDRFAGLLHRLFRNGDAPLEVGADLAKLPVTDRPLWAPGLTEDNVRRIRPGMTLLEVEALLGGPAADTFEMPADYPAYRWQRESRGEGAAVEVRCSADGRVMAGGGRGRRQPGPLARLRAWLGW
jgi:hypothetical protein